MTTARGATFPASGFLEGEELLSQLLSRPLTRDVCIYIEALVQSHAAVPYDENGHTNNTMMMHAYRLYHHLQSWRQYQVCYYSCYIAKCHERG